jgi:hypothetical protein
MPWAGGQTQVYRPPAAPGNSGGGSGGGGGSYYRGGAHGVESDFGLRDMFAQDASRFMGDRNAARNNLITGAAGMMTAQQAAAARNNLTGVRDRYQVQADRGQYTTEEYNNQLRNRTNQATMAKINTEKQLNSDLASMGLGLNAGAAAALGFAGDFAAAGMTGDARASLDREQAESRVAGLGGLAGISQQLAAIDTMPTQDNALGLIDRLDNYNPDFMGEYGRWRDAHVGPTGYAWGADGAPRPPSYGNTDYSYQWGGGYSGPGMTLRQRG